MDEKEIVGEAPRVEDDGDPAPTSFADELEARLKEDITPHGPDLPADVVPLWGYPIQDDQNNLLYLYTGLDFTEYVIINTGKGAADPGDLVHREDLSSQFSPLAGAVVWVRSSARLRYVSVGNAFQTGRMLQGRIQQAMPGTGAPPLALPPYGTPGGYYNPGSHGGCGTGNNTPGCPYYPATLDPNDTHCTG